MPVPRVLLAVPLIIAGAVLPALGAEPRKSPPSAVGMAHETFTRNSITVRVGQTVTLVNDSRFVHIIVDGQDGLAAKDPGNPEHGLTLMQTNATYVTGRWNRPGTYYLTCTVHPEMTVKVVVTT